MVVFFLICAGIFHCYMEFAALKGQPGSDVTIRDLGLQTDFAIYLQIRQTWLAFSREQHAFYLFILLAYMVCLMHLLRSLAVIILAIVEVIIILLLIFLRKRLLIAIALIKEASKSVLT